MVECNQFDGNGEIEELNRLFFMKMLELLGLPEH